MKRALLWIGGLLLLLVAGGGTTLLILGRKAEASYEKAFHLLAAASVPTKPLDFVPPPLPPERNGADLYMSALSLTPADFRTGDPDSRPSFAADPRLRDVPPEELSPEDWKEIDGLVRDHAATVEALLRAASVPDCRYPMDYAQGWNMLMPQIRRLIPAARLLAWDVRLRLRAGKPDGVWERIDAVFALDRSVAGEPLFVSQLTRGAVRDLGLDLLRETLPSIPPPPGAVEALSRRLDREDWRRSFHRASFYELAMMVDTIDGFVGGRTTINDLDREIAGARRLFVRPRMMEGAARGFERLVRLRGLLDGPRDDLILHSALIVQEFNRDPYAFGFLLAGYPTIGRREVLLEARGLLALEAARIKSRYPRCELLPESIPGLPADPLTDRPIRYRRVECGFHLELDAAPGEIKSRWGLDEVPAWDCAR